MVNDIQTKIIELISDDTYRVKVINAGIYMFPSRYYYASHNHKDYEINYVTKGSCIMEIDNECIQLKEGDCIIINPRANHCFMVDIKGTCRITQLEISINVNQELAKNFSFLSSRENYHKIRNCSKINLLLEQISRDFRCLNEDHTMKALLNLTLAQLYIILSNCIDNKSESTYSKTNSNNKINKMLDYIKNNSDEDIIIEELSLRFGISSRYVRKYFSEKLGIKCSEYINMIRINKAKELLWETGYSITKISAITGFNSSQYFCKVFKKQVGISPVSYRNMWTNNRKEEDNE